jgi:hypothetical protein
VRQPCVFIVVEWKILVQRDARSLRGIQNWNQSKVRASAVKPEISSAIIDAVQFCIFEGASGSCNFGYQLSEIGRETVWKLDFD